MNFSDCDEFTRGYIEAALWLFDDDPGEGEWDRLDVFLSALAPDAITSMAADCKRFQQASKSMLEMAYQDYDYNPKRAGHDFWLTRNHHGSGFWARDLGVIGDGLTNIAHDYRDCDLYRGDNNLIYVS